MEDLFLKQEIALSLKQKGFNVPCMAKWMLDIKGDTIPHFRYNYEREGLWFNHNGKDVSGLNGNDDGKDFLWSAPTFQQATDWLRKEHKIRFSETPIIPIGMDFTVWPYFLYQGNILRYSYQNLETAIQEALTLI